jgi:hypothetical protein
MGTVKLTRPKTSSATSMPHIFPQMTLFLPEDESAQLRFEFEVEMARLETA